MKASHGLKFHTKPIYRLLRAARFNSAKIAAFVWEIYLMKIAFLNRSF